MAIVGRWWLWLEHAWVLLGIIAVVGSRCSCIIMFCCQCSAVIVSRCCCIGCCSNAAGGGLAGGTCEELLVAKPLSLKIHPDGLKDPVLLLIDAACCGIGGGPSCITANRRLFWLVFVFLHNLHPHTPTSPRSPTRTPNSTILKPLGDASE